ENDKVSDEALTGIAEKELADQELTPEEKAIKSSFKKEIDQIKERINFKPLEDVPDKEYEKALNGKKVSDNVIGTIAHKEASGQELTNKEKFVKKKNPKEVQKIKNELHEEQHDKKDKKPSQKATKVNYNGNEYFVEEGDDGKVRIFKKNGTEIKKFNERKKKNGQKTVSKNPYYSKIQSKYEGSITENQAKKERDKEFSEAMDNFVISSPYEAALAYFARGGGINPESAAKETGET